MTGGVHNTLGMKSGSFFFGKVAIIRITLIRGDMIRYHYTRLDEDTTQQAVGATGHLEEKSRRYFGNVCGSNSTPEDASNYR